MTTTDRPVHWTTPDRLEDLAFSTRCDIEFGTDSGGGYAAVVMREGTEYRARLAAAEGVTA